MPRSNDVLSKLEGYEFRLNVQQWVQKFKETPYLDKVLSYLLKRHIELPEEERWITFYKLQKEIKVRGKESFYRKTVPILLEIGVLEFKEVKATKDSQARRYVRLNDDFVNDVIRGIVVFKEKTEEIWEI